MKGNLWWRLSIVFLLAGCDKELSHITCRKSENRVWREIG